MASGAVAAAVSRNGGIRMDTNSSFLPSRSERAADGPADATAEGSSRRWSDQPGRLPGLTFARFLTTTPELDEVARFLVGLLSWPVGATGAVIARGRGDEVEILASYLEPQEAEPGDDCRESTVRDIRDAITATGGSHAVLWTEHDHASCLPLAAWPLGAGTGEPNSLVLFLAAARPRRTVAERVIGIPDVLSVYLAGSTTASGTTGRPAAEDWIHGVAHLSPRQARILSLLAEDLTMHQIASRIGFSESTVRMESLAIYRALGVHDRRHAVEAAGSLGNPTHP